MDSGWDPRTFHDYILGHARNGGLADDQAGLAKVTGIDSGLLGRYFRGETQPGPGNLQKIAATISGTRLAELQVLAGRATAGQLNLTDPPTAPAVVHPLAVDVDRLLCERSPLGDDLRQRLEAALRGVIELARQ